MIAHLTNTPACDRRAEVRFPKQSDWTDRGEGTLSVTSPLVFRMVDKKRRACNKFFAKKILSILTQEQTGQKRENLFVDLLSLDVKAA